MGYFNVINFSWLPASFKGEFQMQSQIAVVSTVHDFLPKTHKVTRVKKWRFLAGKIIVIQSRIFPFPFQDTLNNKGNMRPMAVANSAGSMVKTYAYIDHTHTSST